MDRQLIAKANHNITLRQKVGTAQNLFLGDAQLRGVVAGAPWVQTATIQRPAVLQCLNIDSTDGLGDITNITVAGLSLFVSTGSAALACFSSFSNSALAAKQRSIGISINNNQTVVVQGSLVAGGNVGMGISIDPLKSPADVKSPANQAHGYDFIFGMGTILVPAGGVATLAQTATRPVTLGEVILASHTPAVNLDDLVVESVEVAGLEMLAGATATQQIPLSILTNNSGDVAGLRLSYPIAANAQVRIRVRNFNAAACQVSGGIFIEPWK
tara:strand:- start:2750 stop:3562 length:813 start_codon:yes stop_codon:yes gene_type:complete